MLNANQFLATSRSLKKLSSVAGQLSLILSVILPLNAYAKAPSLSVSVLATELKLSWTPTEDLASYRLYYAPSPYEGPDTVNFIDLGRNLSISGLLPENSSFFVAVSSLVDGVESELSNIEEFSITLKSQKGLTCEELNSDAIDTDSDGICDLLDPAPEAAAVKDSIANLANDFGNRILLSDSGDRLIDAAIFQNYSVKTHEGFIYHSSSTGETVTFSGGTYNDQMNMCRVGNFNGDQFEDIVVSSNNQFDLGNLVDDSDGINQEKLPRTHIFLSDGKGSYVSGSNLFDGTAHFRMRSYGQPQVADLNNDGIDDILSQNGGGGSGYDLVTDHGIGLFLSSPDGTFFDATDRLGISKNEIQRDGYSESVLQILTESFISLDVDSDGWKDLLFLAANKADTNLPFVLFNDKAERFVPYETWKPNLAKSNYEPSFQNIVRHTEVVDFDGDGDEDIVALCYRECLGGENLGQNGYILINEDGVFDVENRIVFPDGLRGTNTKNDHMAVGDINGDGLIDIVTVSGASDPYYVDRDIQVLINDGGKALVDDTKNRIVNRNTPETGHAEGAIYLVDYDMDGDLDIIDWQANVRDGKAYGTALDGSEYPYGDNGLAIFLNDGVGKFEYIAENLVANTTLKETDSRRLEDWQASSVNWIQGLCPAFFDRRYGYGFLYEHFYDKKDPRLCPNDDCRTTTYSSVRRN